MINKGHGLIGLPNTRLTATMDSFTLSLAKKCERLATASYLVTSFLSDTEPLKTRLRALALDLVRDASLARNGTVVNETGALEILRANINETLSLLELAFINGLISEMNFSILKREYAMLRDTIEIKKASRDSRTDSVLNNNFFGTPEPALHPHQRSDLAGTPEGRTFIPQAPVSHPTQSPKGHSIGQTNTPMSNRNSKGQVSRPQRSDIAGTHEGRTLMHSTPRATTDIAKESRRTRILKLIKDKREVAIKDIMDHFPELSEKTIQRDLVSFTESGVLKKSGERRWSRYALA